MSAVKELRRRLKTDETWQKYRRIVEHSWDTSFDTFLDEIQKMHKGRALRILGLDSSHPSGKKLAKAALVDQAYRSRCVEIVMTLTRNRNNLHYAIDTIKKHLDANYRSTLITLGVRGVTDRKQLIASLLSSATRKLSDIDTIVEIADMVIKDIDQGTWCIKHAVDAIQVATKRQYGV
jgi:hypothetical protein